MVRYPDFIIDYAPDCGPPEKEEGAPIPPEFLNPLQPKEKYRASPGDILEISVLSHDENTVSEVVVAPDGNIYYSFLNAIPAAGRTSEEIAADIESGMAKVLVNPSALVVPKIKANQYFMILGKVNRPGVYPLVSAVSLRDAIGLADGLALGTFRYSTSQVAALSESFVIRNNQRLDIDFNALINKGAEDQNIYLRPGDYIHIASAFDQEIYLLGSIRARIAPFKDGLTLVGALAPAYGPTSDDPYVEGNWRDVLIVRGRLECPCVIRADFKRIIDGEARDIYLQAGDIVYVPAKTARFGRALIKLAIDAFISSFISNFAVFEANKVFNGSGGIVD